MQRAPHNPPRIDLRPQLSKIQATWSTDQRRRRAETGRRRMNELYRLITRDQDESEIWAVGAPAWIDITRAAG
jgi:hypothetical protein